MISSPLSRLSRKHSLEAMSGSISAAHRRSGPLLTYIHDAIPALHQRAGDAADAVAGRVVGPVSVAVGPWPAVVVGPHGIPGQILVRIVVAGIVVSDVHSPCCLGLVNPKRNSALAGPADGQRCSTCESCGGEGNLSCAYQRHGRSPQMNFNATTRPKPRRGDLRQIKGFKLNRGSPIA